MDVRAKFVSPNIKSVSFNCPHCGALASQEWYHLFARSCSGSDKLPIILYESDREEYTSRPIKNELQKRNFIERINKMIKGRPFFEKRKESVFAYIDVDNLNISKCYSCEGIAIWLHDKLFWPQLGDVPLPNPDLPDELKSDYLEASAILDKSPRGAAALLRLVIQKLCAYLGENSKDLHNAIGSLVEKGLPERIQKALDSVRVIGNNMVHPGKMDIEDDRAVAETLFKLVNLIVEKMISEEKEIDEIYNSLPDGALEAIERRDKK